MLKKLKEFLKRAYLPTYLPSVMLDFYIIEYFNIYYTFNAIVQIIPPKYPMFICLNLIKPKSKDSYKNLQFYYVMLISSSFIQI